MTKKASKSPTKKIGKSTTKETVKEPTNNVKKNPPAQVNKGGRPPGKMDDRSKYIRDCRDGVRKLRRITEAHMPKALEDLDTAKVVCQLIKTAHEINTSLYKDADQNDPQVAIQINNNNTANTDEVVKILKKRHKAL